jgi:excisionase family DNA binding protein
VTGPLLTARAVAELLDVSAETVLRWVRRGDLPAVRLPSGQIRFRPDALECWIGGRATPTREVFKQPAGRRPTAIVGAVQAAPIDEE